MREFARRHVQALRARVRRDYAGGCHGGVHSGAGSAGRGAKDPCQAAVPTPHGDHPSLQEEPAGQIRF